MKSGIIGNVEWHSKNVIIGKRAFLFCIEDKCMSGRINDFRQLNSQNNYEIKVDFIEPHYFIKEAKVGVNFTITEASNILGVGNIKEVL